MTSFMKKNNKPRLYKLELYIPSLLVEQHDLGNVFFTVWLLTIAMFSYKMEKVRVLCSREI